MTTAAKQLAELDAEIDAGRMVDADEYLRAEAASRIEQRVAAAVERQDAEQRARGLKALRESQIQELVQALPILVAAMGVKISKAVEGLDDNPGRILSPQALQGQQINVQTLASKLLTGLDVGVPSGSDPARDLRGALQWMRDDFTTPWLGRLDVVPEVTEILRLLAPLVDG